MCYVYEGSHKDRNVRMCALWSVCACKLGLWCTGERTHHYGIQEDRACISLVMQNQVLAIMWSYVS